MELINQAYDYSCDFLLRFSMEVRLVVGPVCRGAKWRDESGLNSPNALRFIKITFIYLKQKNVN